MSEGCHDVVENNVYEQPMREKKMKDRPEDIFLIVNVGEDASIEHHDN